MTILVLGLIFLLGVHSIRIVADGWRTAQIQRLGEGPWKGIYSIVSVAGFALIAWGFGLARGQSPPLWSAPFVMHELVAALILSAFILFVAAYVPRNAIKARLHHPMVLSVMLWSFAHLLATGSSADIVLFGGFFVWAVASLIAARRRDRAAGTQYPAATLAGTVVTIAAGAGAWAVFAFWLHRMLIGMSPFG
jgi:uncharacterized membrane protein